MAKQFHTGVQSSLSSYTGFEVPVIKRVSLWTWEGGLFCNPSFLLSLRFQMHLRMRQQRKSSCRTSSHSFASAWTTRIYSMVRVAGLCPATLPLCLWSVAQTTVRHALHPCSIHSDHVFLFLFNSKMSSHRSCVVFAPSLCSPGRWTCS